MAYDDFSGIENFNPDHVMPASDTDLAELAFSVIETVDSPRTAHVHEVKDGQVLIEHNGIEVYICASQKIGAEYRAYEGQSLKIHVELDDVMLGEGFIEVNTGDKSTVTVDLNDTKTESKNSLSARFLASSAINFARDVLEYDIDPEGCEANDDFMERLTARREDIIGLLTADPEHCVDAIRHYVSLGTGPRGMPSDRFMQKLPSETMDRIRAAKDSFALDQKTLTYFTKGRKQVNAVVANDTYYDPSKEDIVTNRYAEFSVGQRLVEMDGDMPVDVTARKVLRITDGVSKCYDVAAVVGPMHDDEAKNEAYDEADLAKESPANRDVLIKTPLMGDVDILAKALAEAPRKQLPKDKAA